MRQILISGYSLAILTSLLALLLRFLLHPFLGESAPLLVFILPVVLSAWRHGLHTGLFATVCSALLGTYFFLPPGESLRVEGVDTAINIAIFLLEGITISYLSEALHQNRTHLARSMFELEEPKEQYRLLVEGAKTDAIYGLDASGYITSGNSDAELMKGDQAAVALQETNDWLEAFSYSASHDLRAPLRSIQGLSLALLEDYGDQLDPTAQLYLQEIANSAKQADQLIIDLLEYGRLARADIKVQPLNLTQLVAEVLTQIEGDPQTSNAEIRVEKPLPKVMGHYATLKQVILNLLTNALKFMAVDRQPHIRVWTEHRAGWVRLWVQDNGIGIAAKHQDLIFQPFQRLHAAETYPGTGIGLAIVRKSVERMGGKVGVESELGQGSHFWIELREVNEV